MSTKDPFEENEQGHPKTTFPHHQLDWRWVERYRELSAYDTYWWWAQAGPFTEEEQQQWEQLFALNLDEMTKERLGTIIAQSRERELKAAITEQREPRLHYPALAIEELRSRIAALLQLDAEISQHEPNAIVRRLYHEAIAEEICDLRLIESTYEGDNARFWELTRWLFPKPTSEEMNYALSRLSHMLKRGLAQPETREASQQFTHFLHERLQLSLDLSFDEQEVQEPQNDVPQPSSSVKQKVSPQAAKRFFESILREHGYEDWQVIIDPNAHSARVEQGLRQMFLTDRSLSIEQVRHYISHELAGHVARCIAGESSKLGLLGIHTKNSLETEEGLAMYYDRETAVLNGQAYNDSGTWMGTLATGLASGVSTPPQTFFSLFTFFESFFLLRRLIKRPDKDVQTTREQARKSALTRCLRTYRGVPNLEQAGVCFTKDALYLRGLWKIERALAQDETVLDRLAVGVIALEQLPDLQELGIVASPQPLRKLANDPELDAYILSFEEQQREKYPARQE